MRPGREAIPPPSLCELRGLLASDPRALVRHGQALRVETPQSSQDGLLFDDERQTKAVLSFLRKTRVGQMVIIPPQDIESREEEEEGAGREEEEAEGEEGGQGPPLQIEGRGQRTGLSPGRARVASI